ncbi:MAG: calcium/proton exchanger [Gemmatimonadota bacterium]
MSRARLDRALYALLIFVPIALFLRFASDVGGTALFAVSAIAIIPLAGLMGRATEHLAERVGPALGGLLNATFGNAAELIIAIVALRAGLHDVVKASITGSIIGNILLVFGLSALLGGLRYRTQHFNRTAASLGTTLLVLSVIGLVLPSIFHSASGGGHAAIERNLSLDISIILIVVYGLSLLFTLRTHSDLYLSHTEEDASAGSSRRIVEVDGLPGTGVSRPLLTLLGAAVVTGVMSEIMVGALEEAAHELGMTRVFVGVILVAVVGNAAEHSTAVLMAIKNKMDLSLHIAVGSSTQIALFVAPVLVLLSYAIGPSPMDLRFTNLEVVAVAMSVGIMAVISQDGESHWMEGVQLLAVYLMLAVAFFFLPV